jgi:hypothetical protein
VLGMNGVGKKVSARVLTQRIKDFGIKFAEIIQPATAMVNNYIISKV